MLQARKFSKIPRPTIGSDAYRAPEIASAERFYLHQNLLLFSAGAIRFISLAWKMVRDAHSTKRAFTEGLQLLVAVVGCASRT
jgi:hypothetical protein